VKPMAFPLILAVGASAVGCGGEKKTEGRPEPAGIYLTKFRIGRAIAPDRTVTIETDSFGPGDPIYISFEVRKAPRKSQVKAVWKDSSGRKIAEEQQEVPTGTGAMTFELKDAASLQMGDYLVEFFSKDSGAPEKWSDMGHKPFRVGPKRPA
jgi:hypothetical protein